ncbi:ABC transporter permease subunit [Paenibacillus sp. HB172176]|uniref:ABC transporter permease n=1 Tax=Paenibacillus sp. HB172176 TaxID=2493690 RepID=UPI001438B92B|nr:ABC transporter permease subunit [Paenibacillus sp. HB172176]
MRLGRWKREMPLYLMILPGVVLVLIFAYVPMAGIAMAFQDFMPARGWFGSEWVGLDNFRYIAVMPNIGQVVWNTVFISAMKMIVGLIVPIFIALLLNEVGKNGFKRGIQTLVYLPHFMSWVILGGILIDMMSPSQGLINQIIKQFGGEPIYFLGNNDWFPYTLVISNEWKEFGFSTIVYLAALTNINPSLYEAAVIDGANRWKQTLFVTLPGLTPIIVLMTTLSLGQILNAGFDQVFNLYSPVVYESGDIIDTMIYRIGLVEAQYSVSTAVGLFKSVISFCFISVSYLLAYRLANYRIF